MSNSPEPSQKKSLPIALYLLSAAGVALGIRDIATKRSLISLSDLDWLPRNMRVIEIEGSAAVLSGAGLIILGVGLLLCGLASQAKGETNALRVSGWAIAFAGALCEGLALLWAGF